mmetsp:Transcript_15947/g.42143  ORF Transcript_15947/g.42143 Transcript_15947/m.42143 type:complete len:1094 (+) Transcript_15947:192-3473(+)
MTTMSNNAGAPQQPLMYYYVAVPSPPGGAQSYPGPGDGMQPAPFDGQQAGLLTPSFGAGGQGPGYGYDQGVGQTMVDASSMGQMGHMMAPGGTTMMAPPGQGQSPMMLVTTMVPSQQQPAPAMDQNPDVQGGAGWAPQTAMPPTQAMLPPQAAGGAPPMVQGGGGPSQSKAYKIVNPYTGKELEPKEGQEASPVGRDGPMPTRGGHTGDGQPQPPPQPPQGHGWAGGGGPQFPGGPPQQQTAPAAEPAAAPKKKGIANKKIERPKDAKDETTPSSTPVGGSTAPAPEPAKPAAAPTSEIPRRDVPSLETGSSGRGNTSGPPSQLPRWPPAGGMGGPSSAFASSIKALNLEPMRASPQPIRAKPPAARPPSDLHPPPSQQTLAAPQQPAPAPVQPQVQQQVMQPAPVQPLPQQMHQMVQQQSPVMPSTAPAPAGGTKLKGIKVKNAAIARVPKKVFVDTDDEEDEKKDKEDKKEASKGDDSSKAKEESVSAVAAPHEAVKKVSLMPDHHIFDRLLMLRIWRTHKTALHVAVQGLHTNVRPGDKGTPMTSKRGPGGRGRGDDGPSDRASVFGTDMKTGGKKGNAGRQEPGLKPGANAYKITEATKREDEIERRVRSLLNKICPDNLKTIVERLALIELHKADELEFVIRIIFSKALAEPHYCETYADMVFALRTRYPEFQPENEGEKAQTFTRILLNTCQNEFESLPSTFEPTAEERVTINKDELRLEMKRRKEKILANMKFIGNLFLRQLLAVKVIGQVVHDLIGIKDALPEEHMIECVCELLEAIGHTLDGTSHGKQLMTQFSARLQDLRRMVGSDGKTAFEKRIQFKIQDLLDLRGNLWQKKLYREQAKTKEEVRKDALKEQRSQGKGQGTSDVHFATQVAGMRPSYIDEFKNTRPRAKPQGEPKPTFDQAYVKKMFSYYADEKNGDQLEADWSKAAPSPKEVKQGAEWILELGFNDPLKEEAVADTMVELLQRRCFSWDVLKDCLGEFSQGLEDLLIDVPQADVFFHSLLCRLLLACGKDFNPTILKTLPSDSPDFTWSLIVGALKKVKQKGGADAVRKALDIRELNDAACKARRCASSELKRHLQEDGAL